MEYRCDICKKNVVGSAVVYIKHTEKHIIDFLREKYPDWSDEDGLCKKCYEYYFRELKGSK